MILRSAVKTDNILWDIIYRTKRNWHSFSFCRCPPQFVHLRVLQLLTRRSSRKILWCWHCLVVKLPGDWVQHSWPICGGCPSQYWLTSFCRHGENFNWSFVFLQAAVLSPKVLMGVLMYNRSDTWHFRKLKLWLFLNPQWGIWSGASQFNKSIIMSVV